MPTTKVDYLKFFAPFLKKWHVATMGAKPTEAELLTAYYWGLTRPGIESLATAMAVREGGYTVRQYLLASGAAGAAHNKQRGHATRGLASYAASGGVDGSPNARVFTLSPTKKGLARIAAGAAVADDMPEPVKKAVKRNASKKAKRAKAVKVTADANAAVAAEPRDIGVAMPLSIDTALTITGNAEPVTVTAEPVIAEPVITTDQPNA